MKKKASIVLAVIAAVMVVVTSIVWVVLRKQALPIDTETRIYLPHDIDYPSLLDTLTVHGCIVSPTVFNAVAHLRELPEHVKPGSYVLQPGMGVIEVIQKLYSGNQDAIRLTIGKYRTLEQLCAYLNGRFEFDGDTLLSLLRNDSICRIYGETSQSVIGMFPQNTYEVYWTTGPRGLMDRMSKESQHFWQHREDKLKPLGLTRQQVLTLASIVEEETNASDEKADIASVYLNRLKAGMLLQADPTVKYALGDFSIRRIWGRMLNTDSPYNTYLYAGLPPGPICIPSTESIDAVLANKKTGYIYFCAKDDFSGKHVFAATIDEHNANARRFHKALNSRNIH